MDSYSCGYKGIGLYLYEQWIAAVDRIFKAVDKCLSRAMDSCSVLWISIDLRIIESY